MLLTREDILSIQDLKLLPVDVPEWGGTVHIRQLTTAERDQLEHAFEESKMVGFRATMVALTACDENGNRLFTDEDKEALSAKNGSAMTNLAVAAMTHNGFTQEDQDKLEGNS